MCIDVYYFFCKIYCKALAFPAEDSGRAQTEQRWTSADISARALRKRPVRVNGRRTRMQVTAAQAGGTDDSVQAHGPSGNCESNAVHLALIAENVVFSKLVKPLT